jgi:hypothetical protein
MTKTKNGSKSGAAISAQPTPLRRPSEREQKAIGDAARRGLERHPRLMWASRAATMGYAKSPIRTLMAMDGRRG